MLYNAVQSARHPQKCPFQWGHLQPHVIHVPSMHPTPHFKLRLDWFSCFHTAHSRESLYFTMCIKNAIDAQFKILIAAINMTKKLIVLQR